jgi:hypothetical protein
MLLWLPNALVNVLANQALYIIYMFVSGDDLSLNRFSLSKKFLIILYPTLNSDSDATRKLVNFPLSRDTYKWLSKAVVLVHVDLYIETQCVG